MRNIKSWIPLLIIATVVILFFFLGFAKYFTLESLKAHESLLIQFISDHPLLSPLLFIAFYTLTVVFLLPVGIFLSLAGGFFFSHPLSELYILIGSTAGSCIVYLIANSAMHKLFLNKAGPHLKKIERELQKNEVNYLLFLRLIPLSPFWLVNLACAFFGVRFWTFVWTTFVGNIPAAIIFVEMGTKLGTILKPGEEFSITALFNWPVILLLITLALFSLLPVFVKKRK